jgi:uncharacterized protein (TIGR00369 family)
MSGDDAAQIDLSRLERWLGDGGMPLLGQLGLNINEYGDGFAGAEWIPTPLACNPAGSVHGGVQATVLDAVMSFALATKLPAKTRSTTADLTVSPMRPSPSGEGLAVRAETIQVGGRLAYLRSSIEYQGEVLTHATATFYIKRPR